MSAQSWLLLLHGIGTLGCAIASFFAVRIATRANARAAALEGRSRAVAEEVMVSGVSEIARRLNRLAEQRESSRPEERE